MASQKGSGFRNWRRRWNSMDEGPPFHPRTSAGITKINIISRSICFRHCVLSIRVPSFEVSIRNSMILPVYREKGCILRGKTNMRNFITFAIFAMHFEDEER